MTIPAPDWSTLIVAVVSAAIGWLAKWLGVWTIPSNKE
jgi:hypothetical protein